MSGGPTSVVTIHFAEPPSVANGGRALTAPEPIALTAVPAAHTNGNGTANGVNAAVPAPASTAAAAVAAPAARGDDAMYPYQALWWYFYFYKCLGVSPPNPELHRQKPQSATGVLASCVGAWLGIGVVSWLTYWYFLTHDSTHTMLVGSFGATSVLVYSAPTGAMSQPRNVIGGHVVSALAGCIVATFLKSWPAWASPLAVSLAILFMNLTGTLHPPGGATALIAVTPSCSPVIPDLVSSFLYIVFPVGTGASILVAVALLVNNIPNDRRYPTYWW